MEKNPTTIGTDTKFDPYKIALLLLRWTICKLRYSSS
ncbi:unnamed protein product [Musa hybrid cultivar]